MAPVVSILDGAKDIFAPLMEWDPRTTWPEDDAVATDVAPAPRKPTLGDRVSRVEYIATKIEQLGDEMTDAERDEISAQLIEELAGTRAKVDAVGATLAMFESLEAAAERECERLTQRVERYQAQKERLNTYVLAVMTASNLTKLEGDTSTLTAKKNPPAVQIADDAQIAHEFLFYPPAPDPRPDKDAIKRALKAGRRIAGCELKQGKRLVRT